MHFRALHLAFLLVLLPFSRAFTELSRRQQSTSSALGLSRTRLSANINSDLAREEPFNRKLAYGSLWGLLVAYVFLAAPGGSPEAAAIDNDLIAKLISTPYDGEVTPLYASLFNIFPVSFGRYRIYPITASKRMERSITDTFTNLWDWNRSTSAVILFPSKAPRQAY